MGKYPYPSSDLTPLFYDQTASPIQYRIVPNKNIVLDFDSFGMIKKNRVAKPNIRLPDSCAIGISDGHFGGLKLSSQRA
jgi:hypothetical protein